MLEICGARLSAHTWNCILAPDHREPWHMTLFGQTWPVGRFGGYR